MTVDITSVKPHFTTQEEVVWKVVYKNDAGEYESQYHPDARGRQSSVPEELSVQAGGHPRGCLQKYELGVQIISPIPETYGFYCFKNEEEARRESDFRSCDALLRCIVPAGAAFFHGTSWFGASTINVCALTPVEVLG